MNTKRLLFLGLMLSATFTFSQNVGINASGTAPENSAGLDVDFSDKGVLIPRVSLTALDVSSPISSPATSLLVYNTATAGSGVNQVTPGYYYWYASKWVRLLGGEEANGKYWRVDGNPNLNGSNKLGTTNDVALNLTTNNATRFIIARDVPQIQANGNGSASRPSYGWNSVSNMGMYKSTSNSIGFSTNGTERMQISNTGNVGIGTNPSQRLHIAGGNLRLDGAFMPNNNAGMADHMLLSNGVNLAPKWSNFKFINNSQTDALGKYYSGLFNIANNAILTLTLADPNCLPKSTCTFTWVGPLPTLPNPGNYAEDLVVNIQATNGAWIFTIVNRTGVNLSNLQFSYFAAY